MTTNTETKGEVSVEDLEPGHDPKGGGPVLSGGPKEGSFDGVGGGFIAQRTGFRGKLPRPPKVGDYLSGRVKV